MNPWDNFIVFCFVAAAVCALRGVAVLLWFM